MAKNVPVMEMDEMETELEEVTEAAAPKKTREAKIGPNQVGSAKLAEMLGTTGRELRAFLRKHFRDMEGDKGKTYVWDKDDPELQKIVDAYKAAKNAPKAVKAPKAEKAATEAPAPVELDDLADLEIEEEE